MSVNTKERQWIGDLEGHVLFVRCWNCGREMALDPKLYKSHAYMTVNQFRNVLKCVTCTARRPVVKVIPVKVPHK